MSYRIRFAAVVAILAVPLVGKLFGGPFGFFIVLLFGGPILLLYLFSVRTTLGSVVAGLALLGLAIGSEVYAIGRAASSTVALSYLLLIFGAIPILAATIMAEALAQPLTLPGTNRRGRRLSPAVRSLVSADILAAVGTFLMCAEVSVWCLGSIALVLVGMAAIAIRLLLERRVAAS
jgi:hypothetical protein